MDKKTDDNYIDEYEESTQFWLRSKNKNYVCGECKSKNSHTYHFLVKKVRKDNNLLWMVNNRAPKTYSICKDCLCFAFDDEDFKLYNITYEIPLSIDGITNIIDLMNMIKLTF